MAAISLKCPACGSDYFSGDDQCPNCGGDLSQQAAATSAPLGDYLQSLKLKDIRHSKLVLLDEGDTLEKAVKLMAEAPTGAAVVKAADGTWGIFSERDILTKMDPTAADLAQRKIKEFVTRDPVKLGPDDSLAIALHKMSVGGYRHIPLFDKSGPVGMISVRDILATLGDAIG